MAEQQQNSLETLKQNLIEYVKLQLGDQIIDIELDPAHYEAAYQKTLGTYRQRRKLQFHGTGQRCQHLSVATRGSKCTTGIS